MAIERKSKQRDAILNELESRCDHPTAMQLYTAVREKFPNLSLGTLYRNLSQLEECGMIMRITDGNADHFDGNALPHPHFKCTVCEKVYDLQNFKNDSFEISENFINEIFGYSLIVYGKCTNCSTIN